MRLKDAEIEKLQRENADLITIQGIRPSVSLCSPTEMKPSLEVTSPGNINMGGMGMNIELQAKMIEELLVKNAQLSDENVAAT